MFLRSGGRGRNAISGMWRDHVAVCDEKEGLLSVRARELPQGAAFVDRPWNPRSRVLTVPVSVGPIFPPDKGHLDLTSARGNGDAVSNNQTLDAEEKEEDGDTDIEGQD